MTGHDEAAPVHQDPMAADRRVLVIALVAMVVFVSVGVVSARFLASSPCGDLVPSPGTASTTDVPPDVSAFEALFGPAVGAWDVGFTADDVVDAFSGALVVTGSGLVTIGDDGPQDTGSLAAPARVVGDGQTLWSLAWMNDLTGQVDALVPVVADVEVGTCVDTAVVGSPFAFHLDASDGELLLLRVEENARDPLLELRDPVQGRVWEAQVAVPVAPPGILAERVSARGGPDTVVAARRVLSGESEPAVAAYDRADGSPRWTLTIDEADVQAPAWLRVHHVGETTTVIEESAFEGGGWVVARSVDDGGETWRVPVDAADTVVRVQVVGAETHVATHGPEGVRVVTVGPDGSSDRVTSMAGSTPVLVHLHGIGVLASTDRAAVLLTDTATTLDVGGVVAGGVRDGVVWLVLRTAEGDVLVGFDPR